jgi:hypothetical protein
MRPAFYDGWERALISPFASCLLAVHKKRPAPIKAGRLSLRRACHAAIITRR